MNSLKISALAVASVAGLRPDSVDCLKTNTDRNQTDWSQTSFLQPPQKIDADKLGSIFEEAGLSKYTKDAVDWCNNQGIVYIGQELLLKNYFHRLRDYLNLKPAEKDRFNEEFNDARARYVEQKYGSGTRVYYGR